MFNNTYAIITQDCVNWEKHRYPTDCLQKNVLLWKANNYCCYSIKENSEKEHDKEVYMHGFVRIVLLHGNRERVYLANYNVILLV